ncbi:hypothetical protein SeLEV6574_g02175 [Synchytrium endobioticum]|uniref:1,3-beta-glucanosyltransferase n=1 Tax=Synchytrium endobioticum TaxID=286115 RepID=A0A507D973_9FUNG|nr:hypothetical protein SeLEV6574_g02175 [Synchytrium endobioticum]
MLSKLTRTALYGVLNPPSARWYSHQPSRPLKHENSEAPSVARGIQTLNPIVIKGNKLFDSITQDQFFIRGVAYQPLLNGKIIDPISNARRDVWRRDLELMKDLGVNVVRVYEVDADVEHDEFMKEIEANQIYLLLDVGSGQASINRKAPSYTVKMLKRYMATVDAFSKYKNLMAFVGGNEVINQGSNTNAAPFVKALIRDLKAHIKKTAPRPIPVGYAATDDDVTRTDVAKYFACGNESTTADFLGINLYEWCGNSTYEQSGYKDRTADFKNYPLPVFLSEYGCNQPLPRAFTEVSAIYGPEMARVFSGGIVYEFSEEHNNYGLVNVTRTTATPLRDYYIYKKALADVHPRGMKMAEQSIRKSTTTCPPQSDTWFATTTLPPTPNECICDAMMESLSCVASVELKGADSSVKELTLSKACGMLASQSAADACQEIAPGDGTTDQYGKYSACSFDQKVSYITNKYYFKQPLRVRSQACNFGGMAHLVTPSRRDMDDSHCASRSSKILAADDDKGRDQRGDFFMSSESDRRTTATAAAGPVSSYSITSTGDNDAGTEPFPTLPSPHVYPATTASSARPLLSPLGFVPFTTGKPRDTTNPATYTTSTSGIDRSTGTNNNGHAVNQAHASPSSTSHSQPQNSATLVGRSQARPTSAQVDSMSSYSIPPSNVHLLPPAPPLSIFASHPTFANPTTPQPNTKIVSSTHSSRTASPIPSNRPSHAPPQMLSSTSAGPYPRDQAGTPLPAPTTVNPFVSSQQSSLYVAPPLKKDAASTPSGARGRITTTPQPPSSTTTSTPSANSGNILMPMVPSIPLTAAQIMPSYSSTSINSSHVSSTVIPPPTPPPPPSTNKGYLLSHIDGLFDDHESAMRSHHSNVLPRGQMSHHISSIPQQAPSLIHQQPVSKNDDAVIIIDEDSWIRKRPSKPQEETLGQVLGLKRLAESNTNGPDDRKKRKIGDITVINDDSLNYIPVDVGEKFLGHILYTGATVSIGNSNNIKQFLLPPFSDKDHYATIDVRIPAKYLSFKDNIAVDNMAIWGTDVYTDDSDVVAMAIHAGFFRPYDYVDKQTIGLNRGSSGSVENMNETITKIDVKTEPNDGKGSSDSGRSNSKTVSSSGSASCSYQEADVSKPANDLRDCSSNSTSENISPLPNGITHDMDDKTRRRICSPPLEPIQGEFNPKTNSPAHDITVTLRILPRLRHYYPSTRHGITTRGWGGSHDGESLRVEGVRVEKDKPCFDSAGRKQGAKEWNIFARSIALEMMGLGPDGHPQNGEVDHHTRDHGWETECSLGGGVTIVFSPLSGVACLKYAPKLLLDWPPHLRDLFSAIQNPIYGQLVSIDESADSFSRAEVRQAGLEGWPYFRMKLNRGDALCLEGDDDKSYVLKLEPPGKIHLRRRTYSFSDEPLQLELDYHQISWEGDGLMVSDTRAIPIARFYWCSTGAEVWI